jgi:hypothetical protein
MSHRLGKRPVWVESGHCAFSFGMRHGPAMNRNAISAVYYYPDEVGIG